MNRTEFHFHKKAHSLVPIIQNLHWTKRHNYKQKLIVIECNVQELLFAPLSLLPAKESRGGSPNAGHKELSEEGVDPDGSVGEQVEKDGKSGVVEACPLHPVKVIRGHSNEHPKTLAMRETVTRNGYENKRPEIIYIINLHKICPDQNSIKLH